MVLKNSVCYVEVSALKHVRHSGSTVLCEGLEVTGFGVWIKEIILNLVADTDMCPFNDIGLFFTKKVEMIKMAAGFSGSKNDVPRDT